MCMVTAQDRPIKSNLTDLKLKKNPFRDPAPVSGRVYHQGLPGTVYHQGLPKPSQFYQQGFLIPNE